MITRLFSDRRRLAVIRKIDRPSVAALAIVQAALAVAGWFAEPVWLAVAIAGQLAVGGLGATRILGPARPDLGFARYAMPASAGIAATLFGRLIPGGLSLLLVPVVAVALWSVTYLELRVERGTGGRTIGELLLTAIVFAAAAGLLALFGPRTWPTPLLAVAVLALPVALRSAEAREVFGAAALGQALLQVLVLFQVGLAAVLLNLPITVIAALMALAFYTWGSVADAVRGEASGRSVAIEYGALMLVGLVVGLLLYRP